MNLLTDLAHVDGGLGECNTETDQPPRGRTGESQSLKACRARAQGCVAELPNEPAPVRMTCSQANWRIGIAVH